jgi:phosphatidylglycerophosphatase A
MGEEKVLPDMRRPAHLLAFGFGSGLLPKAPGTFGTLVAIPIYLLLHPLSLLLYGFILLLALIGGVWICQRTSDDLGVHDHGGIVWDEIVGYLVGMAFAPSGWSWILIGFVFFRLFDILKPWPIRWIDHRVEGGLGIMLDDVLAGLYTAAVIYLLSLTGWL